MGSEMCIRDRSISEDVSLIEKAKKTARDIVEGYSENSNFQIITNELYGEDQRWIDKKNALEKINSITLNPKIQSIKNIMNRQNQAFTLNGAENKHVYWISDFQRSVFDMNNESSDSTCLLYTSDAADERSSVDLGGRRIIKKKNN